jgi:hypothetical protein
MIRYGDRDFSRWLPIGRYQDRFGSSKNRASVMEVIKGFIGAIAPREDPVEMFRRRRRCNKKVLGNQAFKEGIHILLEAVQLAFTWDRGDPILMPTARDEFSSKFNTMR